MACSLSDRATDVVTAEMIKRFGGGLFVFSPVVCSVQPLDHGLDGLALGRENERHFVADAPIDVRIDISLYRCSALTSSGNGPAYDVTVAFDPPLPAKDISRRAGRCR